jgi:tRNA pseudouridine65 synthase
MGLLDILYRDNHLVAINKPENLLVHRSRQSRDHVFALQLLRDQVGQYVYPVHRLDRATSGVLLFALDRDTARQLRTQFDEHLIRKTYLAVVRGQPDAEGTIDYPLVNQETGEPQDAVTNYRCLATVDVPKPVPPHPQARYSLVLVQPQTGRTHQIRRHFKHIAHPLVGDTTYGKGIHNRLFREEFQLYRLLLHAWHIELVHPLTQRPLEITAPLGNDLTALFERFGWVVGVP